MMVGSMGAFGSFINLHLEQIVGLTGSQIGFITFVGLITIVIVNPIWGYLADKTGKHAFLLKLGFFAAVATGALYFSMRHFLLIVIVVILFEGLRAPIIPMLDFLSTDYAEKQNYDYGRIRVYAAWGWMSIAMATGFMVAGMELNIFGYSFGFPGFMSLEFATFGMFIIMSFVAACLTFLLPKPAPIVSPDQAVKKGSFGKKDVKELLMNRRFVFILVLTMLGFVTLEAAFSYSTMHLVTALGASEGIVSWVALFTVAPEIMILPFGTVLLLRFGFKNWYLFALATMMLRLAVYGFATNPIIFAAGGMVHGVMIVMHVIGTIAYIRKVVAPNSLGLAFTLLASSMALSRAVLSFGFGWVYENISSFAVFRVAMIFVLVALILAIKSRHLKEVSNEITV